MRRREFVTLVGGAAVSWPISSHAQQSDKTRLIGVLMGYAESDLTARSEVAAFRGGLAKLGWTEGSNLRIELRWGNADPDRIRTLAKELIDLRPDVILSQTTIVTGVLARETRTKSRRAGVAPSLLFNWRRRMLEGGLQAVQADEDVVGTSRVRELERRVRELERLLGRKTMEVEILKEALDVARVKKPSLQLPSWNDRKDGSP